MEYDFIDDDTKKKLARGIGRKKLLEMNPNNILPGGNKQVKDGKREEQNGKNATVRKDTRQDYQGTPESPKISSRSNRDKPLDDQRELKRIEKLTENLSRPTTSRQREPDSEVTDMSHSEMTLDDTTPLRSSKREKQIKKQGPSSDANDESMANVLSLKLRKAKRGTVPSKPSTNLDFYHRRRKSFLKSCHKKKLSPTCKKLPGLNLIENGKLSTAKIRTFMANETNYAEKAPDMETDDYFMAAVSDVRDLMKDDRRFFNMMDALEDIASISNEFSVPFVDVIVKLVEVKGSVRQVYRHFKEMKERHDENTQNSIKEGD